MNDSKKILRPFFRKIEETAKGNEFFEKYVVNRFLEKFLGKNVQCSKKNVMTWINNLVIFLASNDINAIYEKKGVAIDDDNSLVDATEILLVDFKADVNAEDDLGITALMWATIKGNVEMASLLIGYGADVSKKEYLDEEWDEDECPEYMEPESFGNDALLYAAYYNRVEIAELLLEYGADVNSVDIDGWTSLMKSAMGGYLDMVKLLLKYNADRFLIDDDGNTALMWASEAEENSEEIMRLIIGN